MTTTQRIIKELHIMGAISEQTALNAKDVAELADTKQARARLCELRDQGLVIASSRTGKNKYWLTLAGVEFAEKMEETKQDQSTDANLNQANNDNENSGLNDAALINEATSQANSDIPPPQYNPDDVSFKPVDQRGEQYRAVIDDYELAQSYLEEYAVMETDDTVAVPESENPYNPQYEMMGCALIDDVVANNVEAFNRMDDVAVKREIPPPQYDPKDVAFTKPDITESWYMVDGIAAQFETSSDAIAAAHDYVATHTMSTTVHIVASRKFAVIKPVVTTELEYL